MPQLSLINNNRRSKKKKRKAPPINTRHLNKKMKKSAGKIKKTVHKRVKKSLTMTQQMYLNLYLYLILRMESVKTELIESLLVLKKGLAKETEETKVMLEIYMRQSQGLATKREIKKANKQFKDVMKGLGLGVIIVLPFAPITLPLIVKLGQRVGVDVLPDSFKSKN